MYSIYFEEQSGGAAQAGSPESLLKKKELAARARWWGVGAFSFFEILTLDNRLD